MLRISPQIFFYLFLLSITGCISPKAHSPEPLSPQLQRVKQQYEKNKEQAAERLAGKCKYERIEETNIGPEIISSEEFLSAYNVILPFKIADHLYSRGWSRSLLKERQRFLNHASKDSLVKVEFIDALLEPKGINEALKEHQHRQRLWIDSAKKNIAQLDNSDETYRKLVRFDDDWLGPYHRSCTDWRPRKYYIDATETVDGDSMPITNEADDVLSLQKSVQEKLYTILTSGTSAIPQKLTQFNTVHEEWWRLFSTYIRTNGGVSSRALTRAGIYDAYKVRQRKMLKLEKIRKQEELAAKKEKDQRKAKNVKKYSQQKQRTNRREPCMRGDTAGVCGDVNRVEDAFILMMPPP